MSILGYLRSMVWICILCLPVTSYATHLVGGVMNYRYLGEDQYEIDLYVYRDCKRALADFDSYAIIRIWDGSMENYYFFELPRVDTLDATLTDPCATIQPDECVDWTKYTGVISLPAIDGDYTVYYQRCCRNNSIDNLTRDPFSDEIVWGATNAITIPVRSGALQNSSPVISNYPPVYICANKPIQYDHSAVDADGDSLVYGLCTPFTGATTSDPLNYYVEEVPPFDTVVWKNPYSLSNLLGGTPLSINSRTGLLTGTPNTVGQFVVGISIDEYRNGTFISRTIRDFQFNVVDCGLQVISSFFAPDIQCNDSTVVFNNLSSGASTFKWYFGDGDSSTAQFPTHTYRDTGRYTVTLICNEGSFCSSTYTQEISIQIRRIQADFNTSALSCLSAGNSIQLNDLSTDFFGVSGWKWTFSDSTISYDRNPVFTYNGTDTAFSATLLVTSVNGCTASQTQTFPLHAKATYAAPNDTAVCQGREVLLNAGISSMTPYTINWQFNGGSQTNNNQSAISFTPATSQTVYFTITNRENCSITDSAAVTVYTLPEVDATADPASIFRGDTAQLTATERETYTYQWSPSNTLSDSSSAVTIAKPLTTTTYQITVTDENGCRNQDTALVQVTPRECSEKLIFIPNAFTPNGDGTNDTFRVRSEILTEMILKIYDRWGNEVFYTNNMLDGWDGQYKGAAAPPDVYGFTMSGTCLENKKIVIKGNITLLR